MTIMRIVFIVEAKRNKRNETKSNKKKDEVNPQDWGRL